MKLRKKNYFLIIPGVFALVLFAAALSIFLTKAKAANFTDILKDGDIVLQTSTTRQSAAVGMASGSLYTHMGIIKMTDKGPVVVEAAGPVRETPLGEWIKRGYLERMTVMRYKDLPSSKAKKILNEAKRYYGQAYDTMFIFDNGKLYCSELVYLAFKRAGLEIGMVQQVRDMSLNNSTVQRLFEQRWRDHPSCKKVKTSAECWDKVMDQKLITPVSLARDSNLERIYTNYSL